MSGERMARPGSDVGSSGDPSIIPAAPEEIGILLTYACTARCDMCCFECRPGRPEKLSLPDGLTFVRQAAEVLSIHTVVYSGGEPFLLPDLLQALVREAARLGLRVKAVTNAYWAVTADVARRRLEPLARAGLGVLEITCDTFHQAYVPLENVRTAARAANEAGLEVHLATVVTRRSARMEDVLAEMGPGVRIDRRAELPCLPVGRAAARVPREDFDLKDGLPPGHCDLLRIPAIDPTGTAYACCGVAGFLPPLALGRPAERPLSELLAAAEDDPLILALSLGGPERLARLLASSGGKFLPDGAAFVHPCHLCHSVLADPAMAGLLHELLEPRRLLMMIERDIATALDRKAEQAGRESES
jgi:pyruvate-formate lyase-activating enzyme